MTASALPKNPALANGTLLGDRFEIDGVVGEGAMGVVFRAKDKATGQPAAVKVLHKQLAQSREFLSRFKREANVASRFRHDNAVRVLGAGETDERAPYIAMELVVGRSLKEIVETDAPMPAGRASNIVAQLLRALGAAHRAGIVHRDMKPGNIRVAVDEDGIERPKILDFGVAKFISGDMGELTGGLKTKTGTVLGTPKYMAPEQIRGEALDGRADVYSCGALFYEMLCGKPPFEADDVFGFVAMHLKERVLPISERFPEIDVPEDLDELVLSMLAKDPKDRPGDAATLAEEVAKFAVEDPRAAEKTKALKRGIAAVAAGGVVGAAAGLFLAAPGVESAGSIAPAVAAASIGLGGGAAVAAKLFPRPSVYGFVKRIGIVAAAVAVCGAATIPVLSVPAFHASCVASAFALTALLSYVGYLTVWNAKARGLRILAAGFAAPLLAAALLPVLVAPKKRDPYFVGRFSTPPSEMKAIEDDARLRSLLGAASIGLAFGLASTLLPRPGAARK
jgi:hypothetical protein